MAIHKEKKAGKQDLLVHLGKRFTIQVFFFHVEAVVSQITLR